MATKKSNKSLWIMLALIVAIIAALFLLPSCGSRANNATAQSAESEAEQTTLVKAGEMAPDFTVEMFSGERLSLSALRGKVVLINFWATWCPPCRAELARAQKDLIDRFAGRDFVFLPVSREETRETVAAFREQNGHTFPMGLDPGREAYDLYASNFIPRNFLIDRSGKVILASTGYEPEEFDALIRTIEKTLE